jgi:hypothetical protein
MRIRPPVAALMFACSIALAGTASGQTAPPEKPGRFTMQPIDGGFLRLDTESGAMSLCTKRGASVVCEPVDDQRASQGEIERLTQENKALKEDLKRLEELVTADGSNRPARGPKFNLPTEDDVDKAMSYVERMLKKFREKMRDLEQPGRGTL